MMCLEDDDSCLTQLPQLATNSAWRGAEPWAYMYTTIQRKELELELACFI